MISRMYKDVKTWNPIVGCRFNCIYCKPSFQRQAKRRRKWCELCYKYIPHFHPERLDRVPKAKTIFACAFGDIYFAKLEWLEKVIEVIRRHEDKTFFLQTKNPEVFIDMEMTMELPDNLILGITLETNRDDMYTKYNISKAPTPFERYNTFRMVKHPRKFVTVEPILDFTKDLVYWIRDIKPEFVYVGYDTHNCRLPEPESEKTLELLRRLREFTEVREKEIRPAWWEIDNTIQTRLF